MSDQKIALITGASRGIGQSILLKLAKSGFYVVGTATSDKGVGAINESLSQAGLAGEGRVLNLTDTASIEGFVSELLEAHGNIDVLVNNAGVTRDNLFMRMSADEWNTVVQTNLNAIFHLTKALIRPMMKARWGRIISISSVVGATGNPGQANYCATKAGVIGFSKALAREIASRGITVNAVSPGFIQTDMTGALNDDQKSAILTAVPMGKMGSPEDIAAAVDFLASESAGYITGENIHVNGGMYMA